MKVNPIINTTNFRKPAFKGYICDARTPWNTLSEQHLIAGMNTGRRYEKTQDSFHSNVTGKIYYADPLEQVSDSIREQVDYVFYDDEPKFPNLDNEVSKVYFYPAETGQKFEVLDKIKAFREYFYRLEMADRKTVGNYEHQLWNNIDPIGSKEKADYFKAHVADAQYNQETAAVCESIYREALGAINQKDSIYGEMQSLKWNIKERNKEFPKAKKELKQREQLGKILERKITELKMRQDTFLKLNKSLESSLESNKTDIDFTKTALEYNKENLPHTKAMFSFTDFLARPIASEGYQNVSSQLLEDNSFEQDEKETMAVILKHIETSLNKYNKELENNTLYMNKIKNYIKNLPAIIEDLEKRLKNKNIEFTHAKAKLIPHFDKLKNYFNSRGIRVIR